MWQNATPFETYLPPIRIDHKASITVYQAMKVKSRVPIINSYQYTITLEESIGDQLGMPEYIQGSHNIANESLNNLPGSRARLDEGDVLVSKGRAAFKKSADGGGRRFMLIHFWPHL